MSSEDGNVFRLGVSGPTWAVATNTYISVETSDPLALHLVVEYINQLMHEGTVQYSLLNITLPELEIQQGLSLIHI